MPISQSPPRLADVLRVLREQDGLAVFDAGQAWSVVTWGTGEAVRCGPQWRTEARRLLTGTSRAAHLPYSGGLVGWLGYEAGQSLERMPSPQGDRRVDDLLLWRTEGGLCLHHPTQTWHTAGSSAFIERADSILQAATRTPWAAAAGGLPPSPPAGTAAHYTSGVKEILSHIRAGSVYQVCLAWEQEGAAMADPLQAWLVLRANNPAERGAYLQRDGISILSNSPELFLSVEPTEGRWRAQSMPIKGTARCAAGDSGRLALWESAKERAELTMIVDLVRNDLGRVSAAGSVRASPRHLRRCGDLLHAEQRVHSTLETGLDAFDAVAAAFPPGSVTGAPKVAAMEIINRLERTPRGVYTGSIGFFCDDGRAHLNVAIRTATVADGRCSFHVGAGIVADSDPEREWAET